MVKGTKVKSTRKARSRREKKNKSSEQVPLVDKINRLFYGWMRKKKQKPTELINNKFEIKNQIGQGTFGNVYMAINIYTRVAIAVKLEMGNTPHPQLKYEYKIYEKLGCNVEGFLEVFYYGIYMKSYNCLCMELLGPDLDDLFGACNNHFSLKTVLMIAIRTIKLVRFVHSKNIIYRDVKPENFCIGHHYQQKEKIIYIVDFGLSKMFEDWTKLMEQSEYNYLIGTARYMSVNALSGHTQSKRDDMEALGYMYIYFLYGKLPWMGLSQTNAKNEQAQFLKILKMKRNTSADELCPDCPAIATYLNYTKSLRFEDEPHYSYCLRLMDEEMKAHGFENDGIYDWTEIMGKSYLTEALSIDPDD